MASRPSIADLAREAQVSVSTIDRILSGRGHVKPVTVEHVLVTAERIGFHGVNTIRSRLGIDAAERVFGFLLNRRERRLYSGLAEQLETFTLAAQSIKGRAVIRHLNDPTPAATAEALLDLGRQCDAVAGVFIDHPQVNMAVTELANRSIPVLPILTELTSPLRSGFIGSNDWQLGRTAGWFMQKLCLSGGKVLVMIGSDRFLCQQSCEASFRSFVRSSLIKMDLLETVATDEADTVARERLASVLDEHPDLAGVFVAGGGLDGVTAALEESRRSSIAVIGTELTNASQAGLVAGTIDVILSHPVSEIAGLTVKGLIALTRTHPNRMMVQHMVPFQTWTPENC